MPELPEIRNLSGQIDHDLKGAVIRSAEVTQPKCLNRPVEEWTALLAGRRIGGAVSKGKWCVMPLDSGAELRLNLGMGGEFLLHGPEKAVPEKRRILLGLEDGRRISVNFWWFGSLHVVQPGEEHREYDHLGVDALDENLDAERFRQVYRHRRAAIKTLLLDQKIICGMGNYYSHDILFEAHVHPMRRACDLTEEEYVGLYSVMRETFIRASEAGGADYERDLYNRLGGWSRRLVGYRAGEACPVCGTTIEEIRTGATNGFVCPKCQKNVDFEVGSCNCQG